LEEQLAFPPSELISDPSFIQSTIITTILLVYSQVGVGLPDDNLIKEDRWVEKGHSEIHYSQNFYIILLYCNHI
jgi:hypothetical protein